MHKLSYGFLCKTQNVANCVKTFANPIDKHRKMMYNDVTSRGTDVRFPEQQKGKQKMKKYEVITTQQSKDKARVIHEYFDDYEVARQYADDICLNDNRTVSCSIYKNGFLVMDVL